MAARTDVKGMDLMQVSLKVSRWHMHRSCTVTTDSASGKCWCSTSRLSLHIQSYKSASRTNNSFRSQWSSSQCYYGYLTRHNKIPSRCNTRLWFALKIAFLSLWFSDRPNEYIISTKELAKDIHRSPRLLIAIVDGRKTTEKLTAAC